MAAEHADLELNVPPPAPLLVAGLQGSGKTTTCAKLARWLAERHGRKALLASCDVYRPAAIEQLRVLAAEVDTPFFETGEREPVAIARAAVAEARRRFVDFVILDTAGRLHVDEEMMREASAIHSAVSPVETLFVADAMTGQDAVNVARAFGEGAPADRRGAHQGGRRRARRGRALGALGDRKAGQVPRHRREARRAGSVPCGSDRVAHPRHGRRADPDRRGGAQGRSGTRRRSSPARWARASASTSRTSATRCGRCARWGECERS